MRVVMSTTRIFSVKDSFQSNDRPTHSIPSRLAFETIENTLLVEIEFAGFRKLLFSNHELMKFQIHYLEKNWLLHKDAREIELVQDDASLRYLQFTKDFPLLVNRLPLYHIASHLGITPTQLSRIRAKLATP